MRRLVQMSTQTSQWFTETVTADVILFVLFSKGWREKKPPQPFVFNHLK